MTVKAKFTCSSVMGYMASTPGAIGYLNARLHAVYGKEGDNSDYAAATPSGHLELIISADRPAANFFEQGKNYYLTFELASE